MTAPLIAGTFVSIVNMAAVPVGPGTVLLLGMGFGVAYGLMTGLLFSYDISQPRGVGALFSTSPGAAQHLCGFVLGNLIYIFFGPPSSASAGSDWISYKARGSSGFGVDVLQTIGTVNLGGAGNHEKVHVLQARVFGPLFLPFVVANYIINGLVQILFTITIGAILKATGVRDTAYLRPPKTYGGAGFLRMDLRRDHHRAMGLCDRTLKRRARSGDSPQGVIARRAPTPL